MVVTEAMVGMAVTAAMTIDEVERWLGHAIAGVYHRELHRGIGMPPAEAWRRGIAGHGAASAT